jgi:hypothetical protein
MPRKCRKPNQHKEMGQVGSNRGHRAFRVFDPKSVGLRISSAGTPSVFWLEVAVESWVPLFLVLLALGPIRWALGLLPRRGRAS